MLHFDARVVFSKPRSGYCTITATIPLWPPSALRRTRLESTGLGIVWPWLPHPIIPSNRTGLSNHHGSVYSFLPKALTHTVPSAWNSLPTLLPHIGFFLAQWNCLTKFQPLGIIFCLKALTVPKWILRLVWVLLRDDAVVTVRINLPKFWYLSYPFKPVIL